MGNRWTNGRRRSMQTCTGIRTRSCTHTKRRMHRHVKRIRRIHSKTQHVHMLGARETKGQATVQRDTQMRWQEDAERKRDRSKQAEMGRWRESGRHPDRNTGTHTHIHITLAGVYPAVPSSAEGKLCCASVSGLKVS